MAVKMMFCPEDGYGMFLQNVGGYQPTTLHGVTTQEANIHSPASVCSSAVST
jgi:hypothetical protein